MNQDKTTQKDYINIDETSELTGYSKITLANYRSRKIKLPFYRQGKQIWYKRSEVLAFIEGSRVSVSEDTEVAS
jgi:hypothetical protein